MRVDDFFGLNLDLTHFQVDNVLELIGLRRTIERLAPVQKLIAESGKEHPIVSIGKRQFALKALRPLYDKGVQAHDPRFFAKEVNTGTEADRHYAAEEKLLQFGLILATGKTLKQLEQQGFKPDTAALRSLPRQALFERLWDILADHTRDIVLAYKAKHHDDDKNDKPSLWRRLFS